LEEINKGFRLARDLRLLHDLAPPIHNANAREFQRDVDSDIVFHGCPPSPNVWGRLSRDPVSNIYRGTATFTARSVQGPLRHLELLVLFPAGTAWEVHYDISVR